MTPGGIVQKIAIYGKGGSGKSTVSAALSVLFARAGKRVLHVGCDPKADSTFTITGGKRIQTLLDLLGQGRLRPGADEFVVRGRFGIDCIEAGGPKPGAGCGGRGIARMFELFDDIGLLQQRAYDVVMFDVLGDVVCGGFAAPLRMGFADRAFIVVSEEPLSIYAANNIVHAVDTYSANGVKLGGLILNVSDDLEAVGMVSSFATAIGTTLAGIIPRDKEIQRIERSHKTAAELPESSSTLAAIVELARRVEASFAQTPGPPRPLSVEELFQTLSPDSPSIRPPEERSPQASETQVPVNLEPQAEGGVAAEPLARSLPTHRTVRGGAASRTGIARLLGLEQGDLAKRLLEVTEVRFARERLLATISGPALAPMTFEFKHVSEGPGYGVVNDLSLSHATALTASNRPLMERLVKRSRKAGLRFSHLVQMLERDPEAELEATQEEQKDLVRSRVGGAARHWSVWGGDGTAGVFIYDQERARQVLGELRLGDGAIRVHHGTEACQASEEDTDVHTSHFVRFPWRLRGVRKGQAQEAGQVLTNIRDYELIAGSNDRLSAALESVGARGAGAPVVVDVSCTPVIAGEDWQGTVSRFQQSYDGLVVASAVGGTDLTAGLLAAGQEVLAEASWTQARDGIHWVGFPRSQSSDELAQLLEVAGITVRQRVVPMLSLEGLSHFGDAAGVMVWPQQEYRPLTEQLFAHIPLPKEAAVPPFGIRGVEEFVGQAARMAGYDARAARRAVSGAVEATQAILEPLIEAAAGRRIGFALTARQAHLLNDPGAMCGVPVVSFLESLGFQVEVLHDSQDVGRLEWWLRSGLALVYSDLTYDRRLQRAGLGHFALADLEPGLAGAVRTSRRLLRLCNARFFANYGRFTAGE